MLLAERAWSKNDLLNATEDLTVESLQSFIPFLFSQLHLEFLIHGNVTKQVKEISSLYCAVRVILILFEFAASIRYGGCGRVEFQDSFFH